MYTGSEAEMDGGDSPRSSSAKIKLIALVVAEKICFSQKLHVAEMDGGDSPRSRSAKI